LKAEESGKFLEKLWSILLFIPALLCHEVAVLFPLYLAAALHVSVPVRFKDILNKCAPFIGIVLVYAVFRFCAMGFGSVLSVSFGRLDLTAVTYFSALARLWAGYILRLIHLNDIVLIWDVPVIKEGALVWAGALAAGVAGCLWFIAARRSRGPAVLGLSWMLGGLLPVSLAALSRADFGFYIEPHWLPFASAGFCIVLADILIRLRKGLSSKLWFVLLGFLILFQMIRSADYNFLWGSQKRYCLYWQEIAPRNYWANLWLGLSHLRGGQFQDARDCFERILAQGIVTRDSLGNLAIAEFELKNYERAQALFLKSAELFPHEAKTYRYLGTVYLLKGEHERAESFFNEAERAETFPISPSLESR